MAPTTTTFTRARMLIRPRWAGKDGLRAILVTSFPLMLSFAVGSLNLLLDRVFLAWHSKDAFNAALQAGMMHWMILNIFFQAVGYTATFVAQYAGAKDDSDVGPMMWQGVYVSLLGGVVMALLAPIGYPVFRFIGHFGQIPLLEAEYFEMLCLGSFSFLLFNAAISFYAGQNRTMIMLAFNVACCLLNTCFNTWLIFDKYWIFPTGIQGAAFATVAANLVTFLFAGAFILAGKANETRFRMRSGWRFDFSRTRQLLRYGLPSGVHVMIDLVGFTTFMNVVGVFGEREQFASNMAMNLNLMLFIPAVGLHVGTQILSGQFCGARDHDGSERMVAGSFWLGVVYMIVVCALYLLIPEPMLHWFRGGMGEAQWVESLELAKLLLLFVAFYSIFDAAALIYGGALKGAGDTRFVMFTSVGFSTLLFAAPCIAIAWLFRHGQIEKLPGLYIAWGFCAFYVVFMATINFLRFRHGKWKTYDLVHR
ncbi:MATE family efflux transporter [Candidatus Sumerlaeota bacterium]|nr:MATE family efflux transporter [Candidatus Sumerlaeota bacterium]